VVKFFVLFLLDGNFLHQAGLKLTLMRLLGVSWSYYLWRNFSWGMREFICAFSAFLEVQTVLVVEFYGVIQAMKETQKMGLTNVWVECDSALVCVAFTTKTNVPGMFCNQ